MLRSAYELVSQLRIPSAEQTGACLGLGRRRSID